MHPKRSEFFSNKKTYVLFRTATKTLISALHIICICLGVLTHLFSMHLFSTPLKHQNTVRNYNYICLVSYKIIFVHTQFTPLRLDYNSGLNVYIFLFNVLIRASIYSPQPLGSCFKKLLVQFTSSLIKCYSYWLLN